MEPKGSKFAHGKTPPPMQNDVGKGPVNILSKGKETSPTKSNSKPESPSKPSILKSQSQKKESNIISPQPSKPSPPSKNNFSNPSTPPPKIMTKPATPKLTTPKTDDVPVIVKTMLSEDSNPSIFEESEPNRGFSSFKLLNEQFQFCVDSVSKMMTDETDFLVVGVIGPVSVGKSTILNAIYGHKSGNGVAPFKTASTEKILSGSYQTNGVDIAVSPERVIVIDAQPLESTSMLVKFYKNEPQLMADCKTFEQMLHLIGLEIGMLLFSICHVVLVVDDTYLSSACWKHVKTLETLHWMIPEVTMVPTVPTTTYISQLKQYLQVSATTTAPKEKSQSKKHDRRPKHEEERILQEFFGPIPLNSQFPEVIFVFNKMQQLDFNVEVLGEIGQVLDLYFAGSHLKTAHGFKPPLLREEVKEEPSMSFTSLPFDKGSNSIHVADFDHHLSSFVRDLLLHGKRNKWKHVVSEREWLRNANKVWDIIRQSPILTQYNDILKTFVYK